MNQTFSINPFPQDWHNYHYDGRQNWLAWPWPEPDRQTLFMKLQSLLSRLTGRMGEQPPECPPEELFADCGD
jgi:hypothetical protein